MSDRKPQRPLSQRIQRGGFGGGVIAVVFALTLHQGIMLATFVLAARLLSARVFAFSEVMTVVVILNIATALLFAWLVWRLQIRRSRAVRRRVEAGEVPCQRCGHDLSGVPDPGVGEETVCPECGHATPGPTELGAMWREALLPEDRSRASDA